jgi:hypothetical protein
MRQWLRSNLTYANVMATLAVFLVVGGGTALGAYVVSSNSQIGPGTVSGHKPPPGKHANIIAGSVNAADLATLPAARAATSGLQSIPSGGQADLPLNTERFDTAALHGTAQPERLTATRAGTYVISAQAAWETNGTGSRWLSIYKNGANVVTASQGPDNSLGPSQSASTVTRLAAGDYVTVHVLQHNSGVTPLYVQGELAMAWIGR